MGRQQHAAPIIVPQTTPRHETLNRKKREEDAPLSERFLSMYLTSARRLPSPVCAKHTVRPAELVRRRLRLTPEVNSGCAPAVGRTPDVARGPSALKDGLPGGIFPAPAAEPKSTPPRRADSFSDKYLEISSLLTRIRPRRNPCRPPQVGPKGHTCTASAARTEPAKHAQASQPLPFRTPAIFRQRALPARSRPPRRGHSHRRKQGGAGGIISPAYLSCLSSLSAFSAFRKR